MSKDWYYDEGTRPYKRWFRSNNQRFACPFANYPVLLCDIDEVVAYEGRDPIITTIATVEIAMSNLEGDELAQAAACQEFFTNLIVKHAAGIIEAHLASQTPAPPVDPPDPPADR